MPELVYWMTRREWRLLNTPQHIGCLQHFATSWTIVRIGGDSAHQSGILPVGSFVIHLLRTAFLLKRVLPPSSVAKRLRAVARCRERLVLPLLSVGETTLRLYSAMNYSQNSALVTLAAC